MSTVPRRIVSIGSLFVTAVLLLLLVPIWIPVAAVIDLIRLRTRLPTVRLLLFGLGWSWLECASVALAVGLWLTGQRNNRYVHSRLQAWWAASVLGCCRQPRAFASAPQESTNSYRARRSCCSATPACPTPWSVRVS